MELSLKIEKLVAYVLKQLNNYFPDGYNVNLDSFKKTIEITVDKVAYCFKPINHEAYNLGGKTFFNHLHSDQYATFIWFLSNTVWVEYQDAILANKLFYLNKALHGFSCMYDTNLPNMFMLAHACGTVLGKADYSDFLFVAQNCTVGAHHGIYPKLGKGVALLPGASIIGDCKIGDRVSVGVGTTVYQQNVKSNSIVYTDGNGCLSIKHKTNCFTQNLFNVTV